MIELFDTFNKRVISRHKSLETAARAARRYDRAVKRANGRDAYVPLVPRAKGTCDNLADCDSWIRALNA